MHHLSNLEVKQNAFDKAEKTRQKLVSLGEEKSPRSRCRLSRANALITLWHPDVCNYYSWILAGVVGALLVRNVVVQSQLWLLRRRRQSRLSPQDAKVEKSTPNGGTRCMDRPVMLRLSDRVDGVCQGSPDFWPFKAEWTYIRIILVILFVAVSTWNSLLPVALCSLT